MNLVVANLKARTVAVLSSKGPQTFSELVRELRVKDEKRLDNVLQDLRTTGQIHFAGPSVGWVTGRGRIYTPNQRSRHWKHVEWAR